MYRRRCLAVPSADADAAAAWDVPRAIAASPVAAPAASPRICGLQPVAPHQCVRRDRDANDDLCPVASPGRHDAHRDRSLWRHSCRDYGRDHHWRLERERERERYSISL